MLPPTYHDRAHFRSDSCMQPTLCCRPNPVITKTKLCLIALCKTRMFCQWRSKLFQRVGFTNVARWLWGLYIFLLLSTEKLCSECGEKLVYKWRHSL